MITKLKYVEYLISTQKNYTCSHMSAHMEGVSHDVVSNFLKKGRIPSRELWSLVQKLIEDTGSSYLIVDDSVQDKRYSRSIELVKKQYSGAAGGLVRGIGVVNLVHSNGVEHYPVDYRVYDSSVDGKSKNDHFRDMLINAVSDKLLQAETILFDSWYASCSNLKLVNRLGRIFYTILKSNRLVNVSNSGYVHVQDLVWTPATLSNGMVVRLKGLPFAVKLFKLVATNGNIEWLITNKLDDTLTVQVATQANDVRWQIEQLHRELKQLTGSANCQCRKARSQRNHLACCYHAWVSLKVVASKLKLTLYHIHDYLFHEYLRAELLHPRITAYATT